MTAFLAQLGGLDAEISATRALPPPAQEEALVALFQKLAHAELAPFVALLIGEVVALREALGPRRPRPDPDPGAGPPARLAAA